jgi:hypothetical protein
MPDSSDSEQKPASESAAARAEARDAEAKPAAEEESAGDDINNPGDVWDMGSEGSHKSEPAGGPGTFLSPAADPSIQIGPVAMVIITVLIGLAILAPILISRQSIFSSHDRSTAASVDGGN